VATLAWVGCVADTPEVAAWFGDDIAFRRDGLEVDLAGLPMLGFILRHVGRAVGVRTRLVRIQDRGHLAHEAHTAEHE
jgi:hypothetical protein